jgi:predicted enzyme related to lactoylglutathione lyase
MTTRDRGEGLAVSDDWPRPVVHWEIVARDAPRQAEFYRRLFNWQIGDGAVMPIPAGLGGPEPGPAGQLRTGDHPGVSLYIQVRDVHECMKLAESLGGKLLRGPLMSPTGVTLSTMLDPEGNRIVLVQQ